MTVRMAVFNQGNCNRALKIEVAHLPELFVAEMDIVYAVCIDYRSHQEKFKQCYPIAAISAVILVNSDHLSNPVDAIHIAIVLMNNPRDWQGFGPSNPQIWLTVWPKLILLRDLLP